jgi:hypothetical protein
MSALPLKADIAGGREQVRFVPKADSCSAAIPFDQLICTGKSQHSENNGPVTEPPVPTSLAGIDGGRGRRVKFPCTNP